MIVLRPVLNLMYKKKKQVKINRRSISRIGPIPT